MTGFEPWLSGVGSNLSTNCVTTSTQPLLCYLLRFIIRYYFYNALNCGRRITQKCTEHFYPEWIYHPPHALKRIDCDLTNVNFYFISSLSPLSCSILIVSLLKAMGRQASANVHRTLNWKNMIFCKTIYCHFKNLGWRKILHNVTDF